MTNQEYWHNRAIEDEKRIYKLTLEEIRKQEDIYKNARSQLNKTIREYTTKFSDNNGISYIQAKRLLNKGELEEFKYTVDEYIEKAKKIGLDYKEKQKLINSSLKHRIDKLQAMNYEIDMQLELLAHTKEQMTNSHLSKVYEEQYYRNLYNNAVATNTTKFISELNPQEIQSAIKSTWLISNTNFSGVIWKNKAKLKDELQKTIVTSLVTGKTPNQLCDELARRLEVDKGRVKTLLHTETARVRSLATNESYKELEVEKYQIIATLDDRTSDICQAMDLKIFDMKDYEVGVTANPFHCNCRTTTAPYFEDTTERIAKDGSKTIYVPSNMSYGEYKAKYITNNVEKLENKGYTKVIKFNENNEISEICKLNNVDYNEIQLKSNIDTEDNIIAKVSGGDMTKGSCASVAFAYIGNKAGYDVLDFRDGTSRNIISSNLNIGKIAQFPDVKSFFQKGYNDFENFRKIIKNIESNKEYYLAIGHHASIIKKVDGKFYYLELQAKKENGYKPLNSEKILKERFKVQKSYTKKYIGKYEVTAILIDTETLYNSSEFLHMLGYINTDVNKQKKGLKGNVK